MHDSEKFRKLAQKFGAFRALLLAHGRRELRLAARGPRMSTVESDDLTKWPIELLRIVEPPEAERLSSMSWDTLLRNHPDRVVHLSKRRVGMRVGHALMLGKSDKD
jgi:hypothetical protein